MAHLLRFPGQSRQPRQAPTHQAPRGLDVMYRRLQLIGQWARALSSGERRPLRLRCRGRRVLVLKAALIERMQDDDKAARAKQRARWREKRAS